MSLATRISAFFLVALALVLVGFSGTLYFLARTYLVRQLDDRLTLALDTLEASVDIEPGGLEWEPTDRQMTLGVDTGDNAVRWAVNDGRGAPIDRSANARAVNFPPGWSPGASPRTPDETTYGGAPGWRLAGRTLRLDELLKQGRGHPDDEPGYEVQYPILVLVVGLDPVPLQATLGRLAMTLAALSVSLWTSAALVGHWLGRRALIPVHRMASAAAEMTAVDIGMRLPAPGTGDELEVLGLAFNGLLDRLNGAFNRLNEAYDRQSNFAGDASHQLRTPLAALLGQVQLALRRDRSPAEYRRVLDLVQSEGVRLRLIVESLLSLSQTEGMSIETEEVDLGTWVPDHLRRWSAHSRARDFEVEVPEESLLFVRVQPHLLAQILENLLENACKYSEPGTPVVVRVAREGGFVAMSVEDYGPGLTPEDLALVFEPFFRAEQARRAGHSGVGLGLAVARRIAGTFGGTLEARSQPGKGSHFTFRMPGAPKVDTLTDGFGTPWPVEGVASSP